MIITKTTEQLEHEERMIKVTSIGYGLGQLGNGIAWAGFWVSLAIFWSGVWK